MILVLLGIVVAVVVLKVVSGALGDAAKGVDGLTSLVKRLDSKLDEKLKK